MSKMVPDKHYRKAHSRSWQRDNPGLRQRPKEKLFRNKNEKPRLSRTKLRENMKFLIQVSIQLSFVVLVKIQFTCQSPGDSPD